MTRIPVPPPTEPAIDPVTGQWTQPWYQYISQDQTPYLASGFFYVARENDTGQVVVADQSTTIIAFTEKFVDTASWFSTTSYAYTPQEAGYYHLFCSAYTTRSATGQSIEPFIARNTSIEAGGNWIAPVTTTAGGAIKTVSAMLFLNGTTDSVQFQVACPSTLLRGLHQFTYAYGYKIGST